MYALTGKIKYGKANKIAAVSGESPALAIPYARASAKGSSRSPRNRKNREQRAKRVYKKKWKKSIFLRTRIKNPRKTVCFHYTKIAKTKFDCFRGFTRKNAVLLIDGEAQAYQNGAIDLEHSRFGEFPDPLF